MNGCTIKFTAPAQKKIADMKDGEMAVIVTYPGSAFIGAVIQRVADRVFYVGKPSAGSSYPQSQYCDSILVRLLEKGETIVVQ